MPENNETLEELNYLLGNMGVEIFLAIDKGARDFETIKLFSGIPIVCIKGRIPVLLDLKLIRKENEQYFLSEDGNIFRSSLKD